MDFKGSITRVIIPTQLDVLAMTNLPDFINEAQYFEAAWRNEVGLNVDSRAVSHAVDFHCRAAERGKLWEHTRSSKKKPRSMM